MTRSLTWKASAKRDLYISRAAGRGIIEVTTSTGPRLTPTDKPRRYDFIVTRQPNARNGLVGVFVAGSGYVSTVKADLWDPSRAFTYTDPGAGLGMIVATERCQ